MKTGCLFAFLLSLVLLAPVTWAQSAESILERHVKAVGGAKRLKEIRGTRAWGRVQSPTGGSAGSFLWQTQRPGSFYQEVQSSSDRYAEACNGRTCWREDEGDGLRTLTGRVGGAAKDLAWYRSDRFLNYKKEKVRVQFLGRAAVANRPVFAIELTTRLGTKFRVFIDAENYLLRKEEFTREGVTETILFDDYRPVGAILEPFRLTLERGGGACEVQLTELVHNPAPSPGLFDFPARSAAPLPDPAVLLRDVEKNQQKIDEIREDYIFTLHETDVEIDGKGNIKQKSENAYEVFRAYGWPIRKQIQKDGRPLSPSEENKELERVEKEILRAEERKKKEPERKAKREKEQARRKQHGGDGEDDDDVGIADFLRISRITNPRRERFRGQEVIVFEFEPRPGHKPRNRTESLVQKLTGAIWVDPNAKQVARLEARLVDSFKIGGGLVASLGRGSTFVFEQEMVHNEIWLPSYGEADLTARVLLVAGMKVHRIMRFSNYKKFSIDSHQKIESPAPPPSDR